MRSVEFDDLAVALRGRLDDYIRTGDAQHLDGDHEALYEVAVTEEQEVVARHLLGVLHLLRFEHPAAEEADLGELAVALCYASPLPPQLVPPQLRPFGPGGDPESRERMGAQLAVFGEGNGDLWAVEAAIGLLGDPGRLAFAYRTRHALTGDPADLDRAIATAEQAEDRHPWLLAGLASNYGVRHRERGDRQDLDRAIRVGEQALSGVGGAGSAAVCADVAAAYLIRYERFRSPADLRRCIEVYRRAVDVAAPSAPALVEWLVALSSALSARFALVGDRADVRHAIEVAERALSLTAEDDPARAAVRAHLRNLWES